jgi:hypothetical protein
LDARGRRKVQTVHARVIRTAVSAILLAMRRPLGVTVIGCFFLLAAVYLCAIGTGILLVPGAIASLRTVLFVHVLKQLSPYLTILIGVSWAVVGFGLFQLRDWARFTATIMLSIGVAWELVSVLLGSVHFGWRIAGVGLKIVLRAGAVAYLMMPAVMEAFRRKVRSSVC